MSYDPQTINLYLFLIVYVFVIELSLYMFMTSAARRLILLHEICVYDIQNTMTSYMNIFEGKHTYSRFSWLQLFGNVMLYMTLII